MSGKCDETSPVHVVTARSVAGQRYCEARSRRHAGLYGDLYIAWDDGSSWFNRWGADFLTGEVVFYMFGLPWFGLLLQITATSYCRCPLYKPAFYLLWGEADSKIKGWNRARSDAVTK